jgi:hypothetical protein
MCRTNPTQPEKMRRTNPTQPEKMRRTNPTQPLEMRRTNPTATVGERRKRLDQAQVFLRETFLRNEPNFVLKDYKVRSNALDYAPNRVTPTRPPSPTTRNRNGLNPRSSPDENCANEPKNLFLGDRQVGRQRPAGLTPRRHASVRWARRNHPAYRVRETKPACKSDAARRIPQRFLESERVD